MNKLIVLGDVLARHAPHMVTVVHVLTMLVINLIWLPIVNFVSVLGHPILHRLVHLLTFSSEHGSLLLILTHIIVERKSHLCGTNKVVSVFNTHLGKTLRFAVDRLLSIDIDKHLLVLE
jgi:hypothetical protein